ncbi:MAG TPA: preprotein translocase subunit SecA [Verrucomicrobiae bacterium]|nr:preprotein translocase subunit SecA [Verrucomicrobiae bacterium]
MDADKFVENVIAVFVGTKHERDIKKLEPLVAQINALEPEMQQLADEDFRLRTAELKQRVTSELEGIEVRDEEYRPKMQAALAKVIVPAFALVREAGRRKLSMRHFDVQLIGGMVLNEGKIAEMKTGEGKTLVATLPAYLNALTGRGVHIVTVNDYLARRDAEWMSPIYKILGLTVGVIVHDLDDVQRRAAYDADITYGTNNEFGFDYLRDNMKYDLKDCVQRGHNFSIVDEVDSILIDEARTPLIISGPAEESTDKYYKIDKIVPKLIKDIDYTLDEKHKTATLTEEGVAKCERLLDLSNMYDPQNLETIHHVYQGLRAHTLFTRDVDYVVKEGEVVIVDEFTGRQMPGRRWSDGLHQAIEAKEGVKIERENQTLATVTFQNYFRMYKKLSGMTGTAETESKEFGKIYGLDVVVIPTNKTLIRIENPDVVYRTEAEKFEAVVNGIMQEDGTYAAGIKQLHESGQPVLIGSISIEKSEKIAELLKKHGVPHQVLNAKQHEREAKIVAQAGRKGAVTVSTNMAGRGTDILLGGNPEAMTRDYCLKNKLALPYAPAGSVIGSGDDNAAQNGGETKTKTETAEEASQSAAAPAGGNGASAGSVPMVLFQQEGKVFQVPLNQWKPIYDQFAEQCRAEHDEVIALGGLHILGTERHEARRIDNQLRGRAGRQGDPGSSRFFLSLEDDLLRIFGGERVQKFMYMLGMKEGIPIESRLISKRIENAQKTVEAQNFEARKHLLEYDDVMNKQRETIYSIRRAVLEGKDQKEDILALTEDLMTELADQYCPREQHADQWNVQQFAGEVLNQFGLDIKTAGIDPLQMNHDQLLDALIEKVKARYEEKEKQFGPQMLRWLERHITLDIVDAQWKDHLLSLDHLKEGIGLRGYGQVDPLVEFKKEGFKLFEDMMGRIDTETIRFLYLMQPARPEEEAKQIERRQRRAQQDLQFQTGREKAEAPKQVRTGAKVGRNDTCPCGSGKKYKKCCGRAA